MSYLMDLLSSVGALLLWPKAKLDATDRRVMREAKAIVQSPEFQQVSEAGRQGRACEVVIRGILIIVEPGLPPSYYGMSLFGERGFVLGPDAFASMEQMHKTVLWELHRLMTSQAKITMVPGEAARLRAVTADFMTRAWPWFNRQV